jgi:hypothetical protein
VKVKFNHRKTKPKKERFEQCFSKWHKNNKKPKHKKEEEKTN